jgi:hypothetical protein
MRFKGKKPIASYKDTWNLEQTLRPIIGAGIRKFLEVKQQKSEWFGVPCVFLTDETPTGEEADKVWQEVLEKIDYAFNQPAPNMDDYDFEFNEMTSKEVEVDGEIMYQLDPITVTNEEEYERYRKDEAEWEARCQEGYELFGKYFKNLWW